MTTSAKPQSVLADSLDLVKERVKALQEGKAARSDILIELNKLIHDPELFAQKQRAIVVREVNKHCNMKVSMNEIKRAIKTVNTAKSEKATPVDGLVGKATLDLESRDTNAQEQAVAPKAPEAPAAATPARKRGETMTLKGDKTTATSSSTTTSETNTMAPIKETLQAVSDRIAVDAPKSHAEMVDALNTILAGAGATTEEARNELVNGFIAANPSLAATWNLMKNYPQGEHGITGLLVAYTEIDPENKAKLEAYLKPVADANEPAAPVAPVADPAAVTPAPAAAPAPGAAMREASVSVEVAAGGVKEKFMTTIRGNRETGFSSGVVAAATAVVGGGLEMAFKGNATIGSGVGTLAGATGAYFLGNATDNLMESETGRYLLAGAIGVVAGGLGSRIGRGVQDEYVTPSSEVTGALETLPGAPGAVVQPGGLVGNSEALLGMFNL